MKKNTWKKIKSTVIAGVLSLAMIVPTCMSMNAGVSSVSVSEPVEPQTSTAPQASSEPSGGSYIKGDVNGDGMVGLDDAQMIENAALKLLTLSDDLKRKAADMNEDTSVLYH